MVQLLPKSHPAGSPSECGTTFPCLFTTASEDILTFLHLFLEWLFVALDVAILIDLLVWLRGHPLESTSSDRSSSSHILPVSSLAFSSTSLAISTPSDPIMWPCLLRMRLLSMDMSAASSYRLAWLIKLPTIWLSSSKARPTNLLGTSRQK